MNKQNTLVHLIYLRSDRELIVSKKRYLHWREIQDEYEDYMASLGPWSEEEIIDFFRVDSGKNETEWPFSSAAIHDFMKSDDQILFL